MPASKIIFALVLLPAVALAQADPAGPPPPPPAPLPAEAAPLEAARELAAKREELSRITQEIADLQTRAEKSDEVKSSRAKYRAALQSEMLRHAPELRSDIERRAQLVDELMATPATMTTAEPPAEHLQQHLTEYRALQARLAPVEESVRDVSAVQDARQHYRDMVVDEMRRIDLRTEELLAKHRELVVLVRELAAQAQAG